MGEKIEIHNHNLNIHYSAPALVWDKISRLYTEMPGWIGFSGGIPYWFGLEHEKRTISASVEPSGLQFYARLPGDEWDSWFSLFKQKASVILGYEAGEPEDGFDFHLELWR